MEPHLKKLKISVEGDDVVVDESLESRSMLVYGVETMKKMKRSSVLISGLGGVGVEVAKNIALAGVRQLTLHDRSPALYTDLASQCYLNEDSVAQSANRAAASAPQVQQLNPAVRVLVDQRLHLLAPEGAQQVDDNIDDSFIAQFDCVVLCDASLKEQLAVNAACRRTGAKFLMASNRGAFAWAFADFGERFECLDPTGEPAKEVTLSSVSFDEQGLCTTLDGTRHNLEDGDIVVLRELRMLSGLNGQQRQVRVLSPSTFTIGDTRAAADPDDMASSDQLAEQGHGIAVEVRRPVIVSSQSLEQQLAQPSFVMADYAKMERPAKMHLALLALERFAQQKRSATGNSLPSAFDELPSPWNESDAQSLIELAREELSERGRGPSAKADEDDIDEEEGDRAGDSFPGEVDEDLLRLLAYTARGSFCPLASFLGGVVAQECLKALSGKFHPLQQWLHIDCTEVLPKIVSTSTTEGGDEGDQGRRLYDFASLAEAHGACSPRSDRLDGQRILLGQRLCERLGSLNLFMVGSGAIGCELLKCFALMGAASKSRSGVLHVTDPDHVEKSNLNRQFLFRSSDIGHPKSERAAAAVQRMNGDLNVLPALDRVGPATEEKYSDSFFQSLDVVVNALDNIQARLYVDERIVANQRALLESGTLGTKGHVQVVVPFMTESYGSQRDPPEKDVPFCTLKSFPSKLEHTIEWARDFAFGGFFVSKPEQFNALRSEQRLTERLRALAAGSDSTGDNGSALPSLDLKVVRVAAKLWRLRPRSPRDCIAFARERFEANFRNKALQLLHTFPLDHKLDDKGTLFWQAPKRPPTPLQFEWTDTTSRSFVVSCALLWARVWSLHEQMEAATEQEMQAWASEAEAKLAPFVAKSNKHVETDESKGKEEAPASAQSFDEQAAQWATVLADAASSAPNALPLLDVAQFEKDDDSNHHVDFMAAAANLRARMYGIEEGDRLQVKSIAGRIMPAIATTTAAVSGLVALELVKLAREGDCAIEDYKNLFMNLALPFYTLTEPRAATRNAVNAQLSTTLWDSWEVRGRRTLKQLVEYFREHFKLKIVGITNGPAMVYMPALPSHKKRLLKSVKTLVKAADECQFVDLTIAFVDAQGEELKNPPQVRFHFSDDDEEN